MKLVLSLCLVAVILSSFCGKSSESTFKLNIDEAEHAGVSTIYLDGGATLTRTFQVDGDKLKVSEDGRISLNLFPLESTLDTDSIIVFGDYVVGEDRVLLEIVDVQTSRKGFDEEELKTLEDEKIKLIERRDEIQRELQILKKMLSYFETLMTKSGEKGVEEFKESLKFYEENVMKHESDLTKKEKELATTNEKITEIERKIQDIRHNNSYIILNVSFISPKMESLSSFKFRFVIKYGISEAKWFPTYTLKVDSKTMKTELDYFGNVEQWTSKDWSNYKIIFSSAKKESKKPDRIQPNLISLNHNGLWDDELYHPNFPDLMFGGRRAFHEESVVTMSTDFKSMSSARKEKAKMDPIRPEITQKRSSITDSVNFEIDNSNVLIKGKTSSTVKLNIAKSFPLDSKFTHFYYPQYHPETVFIQMSSSYSFSKSKDDQSTETNTKRHHHHHLTLFPGKVQLMVDNQFQSNLEIEKVIRENDEVRFWIGEDSFVEAKKVVPLNVNKKTTGFLSKTFHQHEFIEYIVKNKRDNQDQITLFVVEALPHTKSHNSKVKVHLKRPISFGTNSIEDILSSTSKKVHSKSDDTSGTDQKKLLKKMIRLEDYTIDSYGKKTEVDADWRIEDDVLIINFTPKHGDEREYRISNDYIFERKVVIPKLSETRIGLKYEVHAPK